MRRASLALVAAAVGCGPVMHVPSPVAGEVPFRVINDSGRAFCRFRMGPPGGGDLGASWIASSRRLEPGDLVNLDVLAGTYAISAESCDRAYRAWIELVQVDGPTEVSLGGAPGGRPGVQRVALHGKHTPG
jgi:hypothetical protein